MRGPLFGLFVISFALGGAAYGQALPHQDDLPRVIPRPQIENYGRGMIHVAEADAVLSLSSADPGLLESKAVKAGTALLSKRLDRLGSVKLETVAGSEETQCRIGRSSEQEMTALLRHYGARCSFS